MTTISTGENPSPSRSIFSLKNIWFIIRSPEMFVIALLVLTAALTLAFIIPQQPATIITANEFALWVSSLPGGYQTVAQFFSEVGLFTLFQTILFWIPAALLVFVSLITLGSYLPPAWHRASKNWSKIKANTHALNLYTHQFTKTIVVPSPTKTNDAAAFSDAMAHLKAKLRTDGYQLQMHPENESLIAVRSPYLWSGPAIVILGILVILLGIIVQFLWGSQNTVAASVSQNNPLGLTNRVVWLQNFSPRLDGRGQLIGGEIVVATDEGDLNWQLYRPYRLDGLWVIPAELQPTARVQLVQANVPSEAVKLTFTNPREALQFRHPTEQWIFELRYTPSIDIRANKYDLSLAQTPQNQAYEVQPNASQFTILGTNLGGQIDLEEMLIFRAYRLPGLWLIVGGGLLLLVGAILLSQKPPCVVWLVVTNKGRGSRINASVEVLRAVSSEKDNFDELLTLPDSEAQHESTD